MSAVALRARGLVVERGGRAVVDGVDLELARGGVVVLLGPNGAGKSSLLLALLGILSPRGGSIECEGRVAAALQAPALARRTVLANVEAALAWWGVPRAARRERALAALARLHVEQLAQREAGALSGGEARRVHLARALAVDPDALLLDEPFAGLDAATRADLLYDAAATLGGPERATLVIVHDHAEAWALADRVIVLLDGRVAAAGPPADVFERPPSTAVARFVGFTGTLREPGGIVRHLRTSDVRLDPEGPLAARVRRRIPLQDGMRIELETDDGGRLATVTTPPGPAPGEHVRVAVGSGVVFTTADEGA